MACPPLEEETCYMGPGSLTSYTDTILSARIYANNQSNIEKLFGWIRECLEDSFWIKMESSGEIIEIVKHKSGMREEYCAYIRVRNGEYDYDINLCTLTSPLAKILERCIKHANQRVSRTPLIPIIGFYDPQTHSISSSEFMTKVYTNVSKLFGWMSSSRFYIKIEDSGEISGLNKAYDSKEKNIVHLDVKDGVLGILSYPVMDPHAFYLLELSIDAVNVAHSKGHILYPDRKIQANAKHSVKRPTFKPVEIKLVDLLHLKDPFHFNAPSPFNSHSTSRSDDGAELQVLEKEMARVLTPEAIMQHLHGMTINQTPRIIEKASRLGGDSRETCANKSGGLSEKGNTNPNECCICLEKPKNCVFFECSHVCACYDCGQKLEQCPICRENITELRRIYLS